MDTDSAGNGKIAAESRDRLDSPLLNKNQRAGQGSGMSVPVYSPFGKQIVNTDGKCLSGIVCGGDVNCMTGTTSSEEMLTIRVSVWVNALLLIAKMYAFITSGSLAVLASLVDSAIDLLGQGALMWTSYLASSKENEEYPVGRTRLEPVGVMICAVVMGMASIEVISTSSMKLAHYWGREDAPGPELTLGTVFVLVSVIVLKVVLYLWCKKVAERHPFNDAVRAIAMDNFNDVITNVAALIAPEATMIRSDLWWVDPMMGVAISIYIIYTWMRTGLEQAEMIVGKRADPDFLRKIQGIAEGHHPEMSLDQLNAYHFGPKYLVELEVVMPEATSLRDSHDAGITLQHKIETLEDVERCFVHIDYQIRLHDDHNPLVPIEDKLYGGPCRHSPRASEKNPGPMIEGEESA